MRKAIFHALRWAALAAVAAVAVAVTRQSDRHLVVDAYVLFVGGLALIVLVRATRVAAPRGKPSRFEAALHAPGPPVSRPEELTALERTVLLATETAVDFHYRLRPQLQEIADHRIGTRLGLELGSASAPAALGEAWPLVRPDVETPPERFGPGVAIGDLRTAVAALEKIR